MTEKRPMTRDGYLERLKDSQERGERIFRDARRLKYHLQPPVGWLNDPNGLCQKDGVYHIYHQYVPFYPELCSVLWGHVTTEDFIHYEYHEPAIFPDSDWDANGAYSGSALVKDEKLYLFYTGNVRHPGKDYDYITGGREQNTIMTVSEDGFHFAEKRLLMRNKDYPHDLSQHVRDPYVFCESGRYYMLQGARDLRGSGSVLLFESGNLTDWNYKLRFHPDEPFGYMWECPNYVRIADQQFLIACPQEEREGRKQNHCGFFPLVYDFSGTDYRLGGFRPLDWGFDFYAPQVFQDESGRCILLGWMSTPDTGYGCESASGCGWIHAMTIPRQLYVNEDGLLCQRPLPELRGLRRESKAVDFENEFCFPVSACFKLHVRLDEPAEEFRLHLRESAVLCLCEGTLTLNLSDCGKGRKTCTAPVGSVCDFCIFSDTSSLEIFINDGEFVFTSRIFDSMSGLRAEFLSGRARGKADCWMF